MRHVIFILFPPNKQRGGGGGELPNFLFMFSFSCSAIHQWDWSSIFFRFGNQYTENAENNNNTNNNFGLASSCKLALSIGY